MTIALLGLQFWIEVLQAVLVFAGVGGENLSSSESTAVLVPVQLLGAALAAVCFLKGKTFAGLVGLFIPAVATVGALRLAKPDSRWAERYEGGKLDRSRSRFAHASG